MVLLCVNVDNNNNQQPFPFMFLSLFSVLNVEGVVFLALCDKSYPKRLAFSFLDEAQQSFFAEYPLPQIEVVHRPYSFMKFGRNYRGGEGVGEER